MGAPVRRSDRIAVGIPVDHDILTEQGPGNRLIGDFGFRGHGVPVVAQGRVIVEDCHFSLPLSVFYKRNI